MAKANAISAREQPTRRKRRSPDEISSLILDAAAHEFEENGYSGATTAAIEAK